MITEIILIIFVLLYYMFSMFFFATIVQDVNKKHTAFQIFGMVVETMLLSPIATPIILGIELEEWVKNN